MSALPHPEALISNRVGYALFVSIFTIVFGLLAAKSWLHNKSAQLLQQQSSPSTSGDYELLNPDSHHHQSYVERLQPKDQTYFTSQIFPKSTLRLQRYATSIDHYLAAIRTPLVQLAITILLYTFPNSELVANANASNFTYNAIFHLFQVASLLTFYAVANMDPGIIKPHRAPKNNATQRRLSNITNDETAVLLDGGEYQRFDGQQSHSRSASNSSVDEHSISSAKRIEIECDWNNDTTIPVSYCYNCYFLHPIRAKHCYEIGHCVARYDHYCKLIENAVGAANLRFVVVHLLLDSVVFVWALSMFVYVAVIDIGNGKGSEDVLGWVLEVFVVGYLLVCALTRTVHLFDHIQTISKNQTIAEKVDAQRITEVLSDGFHGYADDDREVEYHDRYFDEGLLKNWLLCVTGYAANTEYMHGIACKLNFGEDEQHEVEEEEEDGSASLFIH